MRVRATASILRGARKLSGERRGRNGTWPRGFVRGCTGVIFRANIRIRTKAFTAYRAKISSFGSARNKQFVLAQRVLIARILASWEVSVE